MNEHLTEARLNALADGTLGAAERAAAEEHVATCTACRTEVEGLRSLLREATGLPRSIDPPRDLWVGIEQRLTIRRSAYPPIRLWLLAAAAVMVLGIGVVLWSRSTAGGWQLAGGGMLRKGEWLETDDSSRVRLLVGRLGAVQVEAGSRVRLIEARRGEHRLELARGTIQARIIAKPRVFIVETPSATAVDLGCAYALTVDSLGNGLLHVTSGWVEFTWGNRSTIVPRDAYAATRPGAGPGTAYAADAPAALRAALETFDFAGGGEAQVEIVLAAARPADAVTLLNLLPRVAGALRGAVFDRLVRLSPPPSGVTRDGVLRLDETMLNRWWDRVAPPRLEKFDPENFGPPTVNLEGRSTQDGLAVELIAAGLDNPVHLTAPTGDARLFIVEQPGRIRIVKDGRLLPKPFLDITSKVGSGGERGLLSVAFHPRYATNGFFYVNYTDRRGDTRIERYHVGANPDAADSGSAKLILGIVQPYANHNGGHVLFGPDGMLYIPTGDGGSGGDPRGNGQSRSTLLGKLLRIDVDRGDPYAVPPDNPFAADPGMRGEIWALGLRNPWRIAFDRGQVYIADVGQNRWEEVNVQPADRPGLNYGWNKMEGGHCYGLPVCAKAGLVVPAVEYPHDDGCSVIGGAVYRGRRIPFLVGHYVYSDWCRGWLRSFAMETGKVAAQRTWDLGGTALGSVVSFGEDATGELYIIAQEGKVYRLVNR